jgi:hypothetical protein
MAKLTRSRYEVGEQVWVGPKLAKTDFTSEAQERRQKAALRLGTIGAVHDGHGLCYDVQLVGEKTGQLVSYDHDECWLPGPGEAPDRDREIPEAVLAYADKILAWSHQDARPARQAISLLVGDPPVRLAAMQIAFTWWAGEIAAYQTETLAEWLPEIAEALEKKP